MKNQNPLLAEDFGSGKDEFFKGWFSGEQKSGFFKRYRIQDVLQGYRTVM